MFVRVRMFGHGDKRAFFCNERDLVCLQQLQNHLRLI